jgi:hypothetical protein
MSSISANCRAGPREFLKRRDHAGQAGEDVAPSCDEQLSRIGLLGRGLAQLDARLLANRFAAYRCQPRLPQERPGKERLGDEGRM